MSESTSIAGQEYARLVKVMGALRDPSDGCPWDLEQSFQTLKAYLVEECYETVDAIDQLGSAASALPGEPAEAAPRAIAALREELGDVLLQVVFQSEIARERGWFDASDVARGIADKMIHRHPHVFSSSIEDQREAEPGLTSTAVASRWEALKRREGRGALSGVPRKLPALLRGQRIGEKAAQVGFDWQDASGALGKVDEELLELREAIASRDKQAIRDELGDLLFAISSLARHLEVDAEDALRGTLDRFSDRFAYVETRMPKDAAASIDELESLWRQAKVAEAAGVLSTEGHDERAGT